MLLFGGTSSSSELPFAPPRAATLLDTYVQQPDPAYGWHLRRRSDLGTGRLAEIILKSQRWRDTLWRHQLFVYKPAVVRDPSRALLLIGGGTWEDELARRTRGGDDNERFRADAAFYSAAADRLGAPLAVLRQVPSQPLFETRLSEDAAIAYTFQRFLDTSEATWPLLLPMVKSVVRAMDCLGEFAESEWSLRPDRFTLWGSSKRGWTAWLTAAVDERVAAFAPLVIDLVNLPQQLPLQIQSWGGFSDQLRNYTERHIPEQLASPNGQALIKTIDPYHYRARIRQPKLIVLGTNDRYWPLESLNLYWNQLEGEKYVVYVPNAGHALGDPARVFGGIAALHRHAAGELTLPKLSWTFTDGGSHIELAWRSDRRPAAVQVWTASAPTRDFRDARWSPTLVELNDSTTAGGAFRFRLPRPASGYVALFGEAQFNDPLTPFYLSTTVHVVAAR